MGTIDGRKSKTHIFNHRNQAIIFTISHHYKIKSDKLQIDMLQLSINTALQNFKMINTFTSNTLISSR